MKELRTKIKEVLSSEPIGLELTVMGWVRTKRTSRNVVFIAMNDGSTINNLQIVADTGAFGDEILRRVSTGVSLSVTGEIASSRGTGQKCELVASSIQVFGEANPEEYPLQPKKHSLEFLREIAHLRPRTNTFGAVMRVRHTTAFATHKFFNDKGFAYINTPMITSSDAEGAGETFKVTNFDLGNVPKTTEGRADFKQDFFAKEAKLTVSGQLEGELAAMALSEIYTFGPTFRAENSNTTRHLAEFWMIEPEMAFYDLKDNMDLAEEMLKYLIRYALENCLDDLLFLEKRETEQEKNKPQKERSAFSLIERLRFVLENDFERITYTEAIGILRNSKPNKKKKLSYLIEGWDTDLQSEHERFIVEKHFKKPVILYDYPKDIKAFYMRQNDDGKTVGAMDILFPDIGEIIGGSQREERMDKLVKRMREMDVPTDEMWWYLDTRRFGSVPHSGFGLGFERMIQFVTGMDNIRDVIPFPRTPGNCEF